MTRSLRFNDGDNSGLYFDPTATYDSETVYTFSCWAKLGELSNSSSQNIFSAGYYSSHSNQKFLVFRILSSRKISVRLRNNSDNNPYDSDELFRDPSAWYHLTLVRNGASLKVYVNNTEVISETISSTQMYGIGSSYPMHIGVSLKPTSSSISNYDSFDGLLADAYFIDGEAKSPTDFIELGDYGNYIPKAYTGSFGTNGFHLEFEDYGDHSLIGLDSSLGGAINWDTSKYRSGYGTPSWSENNTQFDGASGNVQHTMSNFAGSGKYYAEFEFTSGSYSSSSVSGVGPVPESWWTGSTLNSYMYSGTDAARKGVLCKQMKRYTLPAGLLLIAVTQVPSLISQ